MFLTWYAQIIISEVMQIPVTIDAGTKAKNCEYYDPGASFAYSAGGYAIQKGIPEASKRSAAGKSCTYADGEEWQSCAHAQLEVWSGMWPTVTKLEAENKVERNGGVGMVGEFGWWVSAWLLNQHPEMASFYGLRDSTKTRKFFKKPLQWKEYCESISPSNCTLANDPQASFYPPAGSETKYFTNVNTTKGFKGFFLEDDIGHIIQAPCDWSTFGESSYKPYEEKSRII